MVKYNLTTHAKKDSVQYYIFILGIFFLLLQGIFSMAHGEENLLGHWSLDEASGVEILDSSENENHGTLVSATRTNGILGNGIRCGELDSNRPGKYAEIPLSNNQEIGTGDFTLSLWFRPDVTDQLAFISNLNGTGWNNQSLFLLMEGHRLSVFMGDWGNRVIISGPRPALEPDTWYHAVLTRKDTQVKLYLNGQQYGNTGTCSDYIGFERNLYLGKGPGHTHYFNGVIDEVKLFNQALKVPDDTGLIGAWHFSERTGTVAHDISGFENHGRLVQAKWNPGISATGIRCGELGSNRPGKYVEIPLNNNQEIGTGNFTLSLWFRPDVTDQLAFISNLNGTGWNNQSLFLLMEGRRLSVFMGDWGNRVILGPRDPLEPDTWYHAVLTRKDTEVKLYLNGEQYGNTGTSSDYIGFERNLYLGKGPGHTHYFNGVLDEVEIYNYALTHEAIEKIYVNYLFKDSTLPPISYDALDNDILGYQILPDQNTWAMRLSYHGRDDNPALIGMEKSARKHGFEDALPSQCNYPNEEGIAEWGYAFYYIDSPPWHQTLPAQYPDLIADFPATVQTGEEAYQYMKDWFQMCLDEMPVYSGKEYLRSMNGHLLYQHYAAKWGGDRIDSIASEVGENISITNIQLAFTRGAARQYQKPWQTQLSTWLGGSVRDYSDPPVFGGYAPSPDGGHSLSYCKRIYYASYMSGANECVGEGSWTNWFYNYDPDPDGASRLSPLGEIGRDFHAFTKAFPERGIPYTPIAILLEKNHGTGYYQRIHFFKEYPTPDNLLKLQRMIYGLFESIWPGHSFWGSFDESRFLDNGPLGEIFDVLVEDRDDDQDPGIQPEVLENYPALILSGDIQPNAAMSSILEDYVSEGGTLIINASQITSSISPDFTGVTFDMDETMQCTPSEVNWLPNRGSMDVQNLNLGSHMIRPMTIHQPLMDQAEPLMTVNYNGTETQIIATINNFGNGRVIVTTPPFDDGNQFWQQFMLKNLTREYVPFEVNGDIQYLFNRSETAWNITLINNLGVYKNLWEPQVIDPTMAQKVKISYCELGKRMTKVTEVIGNKEIGSELGHSFSVTIPAGEVKVIRVEVEDRNEDI